MSAGDSERLAAAAAELVVDEGMEYGAAKRKVAQMLGRRGGRRAELPGNEQIEAAVRAHIEVFHADTQPAELLALRRLALQWMLRLQPFRPHLSGAAWRGTATARSALHIDLYCDDPKTAEISLLDLGVDFDVRTQDRAGQAPLDVLAVAASAAGLDEPVTLFLLVRDLDELRGALKPDGQGLSWRGDVAALRRLMAETTGEPGAVDGHELGQPLGDAR
jgi:hypothetical protein